ncbi:Kelch repeat-containing family protein [Tripterygium wilfordii]|uniref:Kelch repeat-containing family protein n=1 Tax=Tripterygium wilfordii TaxID=458696 RepID=A0A7J7DMV2_TRIWF|nr:influenza virus NS1A-binding protein homolog [Tripterygium wilfordii]XP_038701279.1 influenza virus NS1A-binding protein homolog [Tripterygium wilfordii]KAF5747647.1 Kelch repeat-containing family protein [Tripterygium wilfordii]
MGAGRKTQTININGSGPTNPNPVASHFSSRSLQKNQLGGVIFGCTINTIKECLSSQLFGLPGLHFPYVKNIDPGLPLFLFNYSDRRLHGIYEAASPGRLNINPYGWTTDGSEKTQYPAQVQIHVRQQCQPLLEEQFKPIIADNYYTRGHFWFELDHTQTSKLILLLASSAVASIPYVPQNEASHRNLFQLLPSTGMREEGQAFEKFHPEIEHSNRSSRNSDSIDIAPSFDGDYQTLEARSNVEVVEQDEKDIVFKKLQELALKRETQRYSYVEDSSVTDNKHLEDKSFPGEQLGIEERNEESLPSSSDCQSIITQLIQGMEELKTFKEDQTMKIGYLEHKLAEAEKEIQQLKNRCMLLESGSNPSMADVDELVVESVGGLDQDTSESIYLIGGYDGQSWLSLLNSYFPTQDVLKSLSSMSSVRSYASAAQLNGELYVLGGGDGNGWYDTVESFNPASDNWMFRPSLNERKGSLAGALVNDKIFAIGGGNGSKSFSDVEMLDLDVGRWIPTRSMLEKRFALAAVELNGALYATGGYDGNDYLNSAERFDPREHSWTRIASMTKRRGCHSLVVLNEKLYALGGFDGKTMVPSVDIFDPRTGYWISGEPMKEPKGYFAAAVVKESIYVIGGVKNGDVVLDTVEHFKEGQGWQETKSEAIGRRCFLSAIVL